jgi:membrane fusion protein (multidrug efflux system)
MKLFPSHFIRGLCICAIVFPAVLFSCKKKEAATAPPPKVQVVKAIQTTVPIPVDFVGQTYGYKDIPIRARTDGFLTGMYFQEGSVVKKGQLLYTIDPEPLKAIEADRLSGLSEAQTRLVKAESDLNRIRPLAAINAVSQRDLDAAVADFEAAQAKVQAEEAQLKYARINLSYTSIYSPINGIIGRTEAKTGEYVGQPPNPIVLTTVSSVDSILVNFSISESEFLQLLRIVQARKEAAAQGQEPDVKEKTKISLILADGSKFESPGIFKFADRQVDPTTGTILMQASFPNTNNLLRPGQFARIRVILDEVENGILIPQRCVKEFQGTFQVYALNANNEIEVKNLKMGPKVGGMWLVESGLGPDEAIVFEGLNLVRPGMKVEAVPAEIPAELKNF